MAGSSFETQDVFGVWLVVSHISPSKKAISRGYIYSGYITNDDLLSGFSGFSHIYMLHTHTQTHTHIYIYVYIYTYVHMHMYIYIYTYLFNQTWDDDHDEY